MTAISPVVIIFVLATLAFAQTPKQKINEAHSNAKPSEDRIVNPASSKALPGTPAKARAIKPDDDDEKTGAAESWNTAKWSNSVLNVTGTPADTTVAVSGSSVVMIKASWQADYDITLSVIKDGQTIAKAVNALPRGNQRSAIAHATVAVAGKVTVRAVGERPGPTNVSLYVGVLPNKK